MVLTPYFVESTYSPYKISRNVCAYVDNFVYKLVVDCVLLVKIRLERKKYSFTYMIRYDNLCHAQIGKRIHD